MSPISFFWYDEAPFYIAHPVWWDNLYIELRPKGVKEHLLGLVQKRNATIGTADFYLLGVCNIVGLQMAKKTKCIF